jgi:DegV family protein with EDD domain
MSFVRVVTDSASDLPAELVDRHGIEIVPLTIRFGEEEFADGADLTPADFWARTARSPTLPQTAAPSPGAFEEAFRRAGADGAAGVVCVTLSGALSGTLEAAQLAARAVEATIPVRVIDSRSVSMGQGLMAVACAEAAAAGKDLDDVAGVALDLVDRTRVYAALDTLDNLIKGGRVGRARGLIGSLLSIKPVIAVTGGEVAELARPRTRSRSLHSLVEMVERWAPVENLAVIHGDAPDVESLLVMLAEVHPRDDIVVGQVGAVIGTHGGPRVLAVAFHAAP